MAAKARSDSPRSELARVLGSDPPDALDELSDAEVGRLVDAISDAIRLQHEEVTRAEEDLVRNVPLPLRGAVRRLL